MEAAVYALIYDASGDGDGDEGAFITRQQFHDFFDRHPNMLAVFDDDDISSTRRQSALHSMISDTNDPEGEGEEELENEQTWFNALITRWKNRWIAFVWIVKYTCQPTLLHSPPLQSDTLNTMRHKPYVEIVPWLLEDARVHSTSMQCWYCWRCASTS